MKAAAGRGAAVLLGAACVAWGAAPLIHTGYPDFALLLASLAVAIGALRLAMAAIPVPEDSHLLTAATHFWLRFLKILRLVPWEEGALLAVLWLEVLHRPRPWHTAVLGAALIAYLLATHLAESGASPGALRPQVRLLAIGAGLLALGAAAGAAAGAVAGAATTTALTAGPGPGLGSALLRLGAAGALIAAAVLVLPYAAELSVRQVFPGPAVRRGVIRPSGLPRSRHTSRSYSFVRSSHVLPLRTLLGCSATMSEPDRAWSSRVLTRIQRRSPVRVKANPPASLLPCSRTDRWPGSSRMISALPSSQMITAPVPRACPALTPS